MLFEISDSIFVAQIILTLELSTMTEGKQHQAKQDDELHLILL